MEGETTTPKTETADKTAEKPTPNTETAKRSRRAAHKREVQAELNAKLARKKCPHCATVGCWRIDGNYQSVRYAVCGGCGWRDKVVLNGKA